MLTYLQNQYIVAQGMAVLMKNAPQTEIRKRYLLQKIAYTVIYLLIAIFAE